MFFIDYITLLLVNMAAGLVILAVFFLVGINRPNRRPWVPAFAVVGLVALLAGLHMTLTWPIPNLGARAARSVPPAEPAADDAATSPAATQPAAPQGPPNLMWANIAFGEMSVLLGVMFLGAAVCLAAGWHLLPLTVYGVFAGGAALFCGTRIYDLGLSQTPTLAALGFILSGFGGILSPLVVLLRRQFVARLMAAVVLFAAAAIWAFIGYGAYWSHLARFSQ